jgi:hypothetical protein
VAGHIAILKALSWAQTRELGSFFSIRLNDLFLFAVAARLQLAGERDETDWSPAVFVLLGLLMLFPLSSDVLSRAPRNRLALWPLTDRQRWSLRVITLGVNPLLWLAALILVATDQPLTACLFLVFAVGARSVSIVCERLVRLFPH